MTFTIRSDIPIPSDSPSSGRGRPIRYPFASMQVGQSFDVPVLAGEDVEKIRDKVRICARRGSVLAAGWKFMFRTRVAEDGSGGRLIRVWRTK